MVRILDQEQVSYPEGAPGAGSPFVRYRELLHSHHRASAAGLGDDEFAELATRLDDAVARIKAAASERVEDAVAYAKDSPLPDPAQATDHVFA